MNEPEFIEIYNKVKAYSMVSKERLYATYQAVKFVEANNIPGDLVECGVWKGGNTMLMALALQSTNRTIYLYDTFEGMPKPGDYDLGMDGKKPKWKKKWCYSPIGEVVKNMESTNYPKIKCVPGKVEETIPDIVPNKIAVLRLDTDWYESTMHELIHLYPLVATKGIVIFDDYGYWQGQKKAVDEYFKDPLLFRTDYSGRMMIKT